MGINKVFHEIGRIKTERSAFDLSHSNITTMDMGFLYPVMTKFTMPGDKWSFDISAVARAMPMVYPAYVDIDLNIVNFFVPSRLLWDKFEEFITGNEKGEFNLKMPKIELPMYPAENFGDSIITRLGLLPPLFSNNPASTSIYNSIPDELRPTSLPLRAYYFIWNEYFRDENIQDKVDFSDLNVFTNHGGINRLGIARVAWLKDYFTSALPFQQRGTSPSIPFEGVISSDDLTIGDKFGNILGSGPTFLPLKYANSSNTPTAFSTNMQPDSNFLFSGSSAQSSTNKEAFVETSGLFTNVYPSISQDTINELSKLKVSITDSFNISELRTAFQIQKFLERNARAGVRYTEFLQAHYNVSPSDSRLDRPEFIGGCKFPLAISDVFQTSPSTDEEPLGSYAGRALVGGSDVGTVDYFVEEYGYIMTLAFFRPKVSYMQGIRREFQYISPFEFPLPEFMHLSERGITNSELFIGTLGQTASKTFNPSEIFGYQGIYDELRSSQNVISGLMAREDYLSWHLAQVYDAEPQLNSSFIQCNPRTDIFSITDFKSTAQFNVQFMFNIKCVRPMPIIGEPGLIDHF